MLGTRTVSTAVTDGRGDARARVERSLVKSSAYKYKDIIMPSCACVGAVLSKHGWVLVPDVIDCVYMLSSVEGICVLALYVDDILASGPESMLLESLAAISRD